MTNPAITLSELLERSADVDLFRQMIKFANIQTGAPVEGNSYEQNEQSLPNNLRDALRELDDSEVMAKYIDIFVACKESELEEFEHSISDLEYNWYLHTV
jgi:glutamine synthetase